MKSSDPKQLTIVYTKSLTLPSMSPLRGSIILGGVDPRLAKPRPGLNSDHCSAARWSHA